MSLAIVTGGAGFIGSTLVRSLVADGYHVRVIDNLTSGKRDNLAGLDQVDLCVADLRSPGAFEKFLEPGAPVYHLAAIPSVPRSISDPVPSHESNINATFNLLQACVARKTGRVVYAASSSAYGDTEVLPKTERMRPQPLSPYAMQKLAGEYYCSVFSHCYGLETVSLRFFNVFGPRQDPTSPYSGVLSIFLNCLIDRKAPTIFGDGEQSRDFTFVEDVAALCMKASLAPAATVTGNVYNAGNGHSYTLNQTWRMLCEMRGLDIQPEYGPPRAGDVKDSLADTQAAVRDLGHNPKFTFEEGLRLTLDWYQQSRGE
ncbi:MAG: SDR family oxidoreductase [Bryobacteraceae bacterium]|nr:SDR family oxidoreductase [Bryobacteraceae bacterium]